MSAKRIVTGGLLWAAVLGLGGCADLTPTALDMDWETKTASVCIQNRGLTQSDAVLVYFNALENPTSQNRRPQVTHTLGPLEPNQWVRLHADFAPLAHPDNANLTRVWAMEVLVDPKRSGRDTNRANDRQAVDMQGKAVTGQSEITYNQGLGTVLRGIEITDPDAEELNVSDGYYRIREFRVQAQPDQRAIVLLVHKPYAESATGQSVFPTNLGEWVFTRFEQADYDSSGRKLHVHDLHGHSLKVDIQFGSPDQVSASLDGHRVRVSTQTYITEDLNTEGWDPATEPPFQTPGP